MVGALRAGHVGVWRWRRGRGLGARRRRLGARRRARAARRLRGLHLLRQVRGGAARPRAAPRRLHAPAAARRQDEGAYLFIDIVESYTMI